VAVELGGSTAVVNVIEPAGLLSGARVVRSAPLAIDGETEAVFEDLTSEVGRRVQYTPGTVDPNDPSRFTVTITLAGVTETLHCRLEDDDTVTAGLSAPAGLPARVRAATRDSADRSPPADSAALTARLDARVPPWIPLIPGTRAKRLDTHIVTSDQAPLSDALELVEGDPPINVIVDWRSLRAAGIGPEAPVTLRMTRPTTRALLEAILSQLGSSRRAAGYAVEGNLIVVSAPAFPAVPVLVDLPQKLDRRLPEINFDGNAFADVMDFFGDVGNVRIRIDYDAVAAAGLRRESPVTLRLRNVSLSDAIKFSIRAAAAANPGVSLRCFDDGGTLRITATGDR
jgi:hypothetical protein